MLIRYIQLKLQVNSLLMLRCLLWCVFQLKGLEKTQISWSRVAGSINLAFDWCQRYWKCLQQSKCRRRTTCLRVESILIRISLYCPSQYCQSSYNSPVDMYLTTISKYWSSDMQCPHSWCENWRITLYEAWTRSSMFGIDVACYSLVTGCPTLWFC